MIALKRFILTLFIVFISVLVQAQSRAVQQEPVVMLRFYPNPATSFINFDFEKSFDKNYTILIYNVLGRKMYQGSNLSPRNTINLSDYERGVYVYQLFDRSGKIIESRKFQVTK